MAETATVQIAMPEMGESVTEGIVLEWHVAEGDRVEPDQLVGEVQTSKAAIEIPSPTGGVVKKLHGTPGTPVRVGEPFITFEVEDDPQLDETRTG